MQVKLILILLYQIFLLINAQIKKPSVQKCCPQGYVLQDGKKNGAKCIPYNGERNINWHPDFYTAVDEIIPQSNALENLYHHCSDENIITLTLQGYEEVNILGQNIIQMTFPDKNKGLRVNITREEACFDLAEIDNEYEHNLVLKYCPCVHDMCLYLCCATIDIEGFSSPDNFKCGYTENEWDQPLSKSIFSTPGLDNVNLQTEVEPSEKCLHSTPPHQEMKNPGIITNHNFRIDKQGNLVVGSNLYPRAKYCIGLEHVSGHLKTVAYTCSLESGGFDPASYKGSVTSALGPQHGGAEGWRVTTEMTWIKGTDRVQRYNGPNHSWLAGLGAAIVIVSLVLLVVNSKKRGAMPGVTLVLYCLSMLLAFICIAFLPLTWGPTLVFKENACAQLASLIHFALLFGYSWFHLRTVVILSELKTIPTFLTNFASSKTTKWWNYLIMVLQAGLIPAIITIVTAVTGMIGPQALRTIASMPNARPRDPRVIALCWFPDWMNYIMNYALPMLVMIVIQIIMLIVFVVKSSGICAKKSTENEVTEVAVSLEDLRADRRTLCCFAVTTVFIILIWSLEIVCFNFPNYWYSLSGVLVLRAIVILVFFCINPKVWSKICACCGEKENKPKNKEKAEIYKQKQGSVYDPALEMQERSNSTL